MPAGPVNRTQQCIVMPLNLQHSVVSIVFETTMDNSLTNEGSFLLRKGKGSVYIAQYPVRWTAQSALHFLQWVVGGDVKF